jgi:membrane protein
MGANILKKRLKFIKIAISRFGSHNGMVMAGNMAFLGMLALFPFLIFLVALSGFFGKTEYGKDAITLFLSNLPQEVASIVARPIEGIIQNTGGEILTISILFALWTAASGVEAARAAITKAYGEEYSRVYWRRQLENLAIVVVAAILALFSMALLVMGPLVLSGFEHFIALPSEVYSLLNFVRFGLGPLALFIALWGLYFALSPHKHFKRLSHTPGALLALSVWIATGLSFSTYIKFAPQLSVAYGSLAGVLIAQIFFFIVSIGFIIGAEYNACFARDYDDDDKAMIDQK